MSDFIKRLRERASVEGGYTAAHLQNAANEIERLSELAWHFEVKYKESARSAYKLQRKLDTYETALKDIVDDPIINEQLEMKRGVAEILNIARAALKGDNDE